MSNPHTSRFLYPSKIYKKLVAKIKVVVGDKGFIAEVKRLASSVEKGHTYNPKEELRTYIGPTTITLGGIKSHEDSRLPLMIKKMSRARCVVRCSLLRNKS
jgi:hypothetical protein